MAMQGYTTVSSRNLIRAEAKMLKSAEPNMVLGSFGVQESQPLNKTDTVVFRRLKPYNAGSNEVAQITPSAFQTAEGITPDSSTISYTDVSVTLRQYSVLFKLTSKASLMYEDDIPGDMVDLTGRTLGEVAELVAYGEFKAGTSVLYSAGSTRSSVNAKISLTLLRKAVRALETNMGRKVTSTIKAGPNFGTKPIEECYVIFMHTDCSSDVRDLAGFTKRVEYGSAIVPIHPREIGAVEEFRFVTSPLFRPFLAAGSATLNGMVSVGSSNVDVYPMIVMAADSWGHVSLKGNGQTSISPTYLPPNQKNHANPSGMFGYVGADFWYAPVRLNENWAYRIEVGVTAL